MKKKILSIFVMCMGIIVPALVADNATTTASATVEEKENPPFTYMAKGPGDDVITPTYEHKPKSDPCHGYVYEIRSTLTGEVWYETYEEHPNPGDKPELTYIYMNDVDGEKITCDPSSGDVCYSCSCSIIIRP